jgi:hypothetical protein
MGWAGREGKSIELSFATGIMEQWNVGFSTKTNSFHIIPLFQYSI